MSTNKTRAQALRAILAELGATPAKTRALIEAGRAVHEGVDTPGALATLNAFLRATDVLGKTAHHVLGHVPEADAYDPPTENGKAQLAPAHPPLTPTEPVSEADALHTRLTFLREHIVSTIEVQGAEVWQRRADDGRPLQAYAEDLARADTALLARLREVTRS